MNDSALITDLTARYGPEQVKRAQTRIQSGGVSKTRYGLRVAGRPDMGDTYPTYWPKEDVTTEVGWRCKCSAYRRYNACSHAIAVALALCTLEPVCAEFEKRHDWTYPYCPACGFELAYEGEPCVCRRAGR